MEPFIYEPFAPIRRLTKECIISEKIDGTNGQVIVLEDGQVSAGSRNKIVTPEDDNKGFARWVKEHEAELRTGLGIGNHAGEWWGQGIARKYGLKEKRFSLFNSTRWTDDVRPACCHVVPILYRGPFHSNHVDSALGQLKANGSAAVPGFMDPEGVVVYLTAPDIFLKQTLGGDGHKGAE